MLSISIFILNYSCRDKQKITPSDNIQADNNNFFVNESTATTVAENFMSKSKPSLKSTKNYKLEKIKSEEGDELIYVINFDEGGFILMPTDNRINPILAYSENNNFAIENIEKVNGLSLWVSETKKGINNVKKSKEPQSKEMKSLWGKYLINFNLKDERDPGDPCEDYSIIVDPLLSTSHDQWSQTAYFNTECPTEAEVEAQCGCDCDFSAIGEHAYAGCVPVAMGMIMTYHQYPNTYNWSQMPDQTGNSYAAELLADIGTNVGIVYGCTGSSVQYDWQIQYGFSAFGYSNYGTITSYNSSASDFGIVKSQIDADKPVIFTGIAEEVEVGHAWVCDGYHIYGFCMGGLIYEYWYLHINWGEGGIDNGFYSYNNFGYTNLTLISGIAP